MNGEYLSPLVFPWPADSAAELFFPIAATGPMEDAKSLGRACVQFVRQPVYLSSKVTITWA